MVWDEDIKRIDHNSTHPDDQKVVTFPDDDHALCMGVLRSRLVEVLAKQA